MKKKDEWYEIVDIEKFVESTRVLIFDAFGKKNLKLEDLATDLQSLKEQEKLEINSVLTQQEALLIVKNLAKKKHGVYVINNKIYSKIIESFNERLVGNMLSNLTNRGLLETAFDSESNDFVFWVPDNNDKNNQKPETD